jgi:beta-1,4-mannosyltransferase
MKHPSLATQEMAASAPRPVIYCYPDAGVADGSLYLAGNQKIWRLLGYQTQDLMPAVGWRWLAGRRGRIVVLNWFEDYMLVNPRPMGLRLLRALALLLLVRVGAGRVLWVRHNFRPLSLPGRPWAHSILIRCLGRLCDQVITHRPVPGLVSLVLPHTLPEVEPVCVRVAERDIEFLWFGQVRRYKALQELLAQWPAERRLVVLGRSQDEPLSAQINEIIQRRGLAVTWDNRFIEAAELNDALRRTRFVVIWHAEQSMIVSGVFYHAVGFGANVLIRDGEFARHVASKHRFVHTCVEGNLPARLDALVPVPAGEVIAQAAQAYGTERCKAAWQAALEHTR